MSNMCRHAFEHSLPGNTRLWLKETERRKSYVDKVIVRLLIVSANNRFFGGLCIFTSKLIKDGVKIAKNSHQDIIWLKLRKEFFKLDRHLFLCFSYISPSNSIYFKTNDFDSEFLFDCIRQDCSDFVTKRDNNGRF